MAKNGGLHKMFNWNKPMLTDSGGFQMFSMCYGSVANEVNGRRWCSPHFKKTLLKITEEGAWFRSYIDGVKHCVTTEISIQIQRSQGADLILAFLMIRFYCTKRNRHRITAVSATDINLQIFPGFKLSSSIVPLLCHIH